MTKKDRYTLYRTLFDLCKDQAWKVWIRRGGNDAERVRCRSTVWHHEFCADPFLFVKDGVPYLFYETLKNGKGVIGYFECVDGDWADRGVIIDMPWHMSYPQVFEEDGRVYMIPEQSNHGKGNVALYEAVEFPRKWEMRKVLIDRPFADSTLLKHEGHYYMACYAIPPHEGAELWRAEKLVGPWERHPQWGKVSQARRLRRCAGSFCRGEHVERVGLVLGDGHGEHVEHGEWTGIYRMAQDCNGGYGKRVFRVPVLKLSPTEYEEGPAELVLDWGNEPKGCGKHTLNELSVNGEKWVVWDASTAVWKPFGVIIRAVVKRLCAFVAERVKRVWRRG